MLGELQETITVTARPSDIAVETRSMGVGGVIERERILELPLPARNVLNLINMAGAAVTAGTRWWRPRANMVDRARGSALPRAPPTRRYHTVDEEVLLGRERGRADQHRPDDSTDAPRPMLVLHGERTDTCVGDVKRGKRRLTMNRDGAAHEPRRATRTRVTELGRQNGTPARRAGLTALRYR